jgi:hypothetical protein
MCSFRLYPAPHSYLRSPKAPGAQYKQNPSFTMSISYGMQVLCCSKLLSGQSANPIFITGGIKGRWWRQTGSNRRPEACKATALPTELCPQLDLHHATGVMCAVTNMVGLGGLEPPTSRLSSARSNQLSYRPYFKKPCPIMRPRKRNEDGGIPQNGLRL